MAKITASGLVPNDSFLLVRGGKKDAYVATVIDQSKQLFQAIKASDKNQIALLPDEQVETIDDVPDFPSTTLGQILLKI